MSSCTTGNFVATHAPPAAEPPVNRAPCSCVAAALLRCASAPLHTCGHHIPLSPLILIETVLVNVEPVRGVYETRQAAQARHCGLRFLAGGVNANELDVLVAVVPRMHVLHHEN